MYRCYRSVVTSAPMIVPSERRVKHLFATHNILQYNNLDEADGLCWNDGLARPAQLAEARGDGHL
jgi:hypothetical protein